MKKMFFAAAFVAFALNTIAQQSDNEANSKPKDRNSIIYDNSKKEPPKIKNSDKVWNRYEDLEDGMWFFGAGVGANYYIGDHNRQAKLKDVVGPTFDVYGGYWFNPTSGIRVSFHGYDCHGLTRNEGNPNPYAYGERDYIGKNGDPQWRKKFQFYSFNADYLFNVTQFLCEEGAVKRYNAIPYIGIGYCHMVTKGNEGGNVLRDYSWALSMGLLNSFKLTRTLDLTIDIHANMGSEEFDGDTGKRVGEGTMAASLGVNIHL